MTIRLLTVFLAAVFLAATACHRTNKAEQLTALDGAYQSGLLTKDEYDAKKLALAAATPAPALAQIPVPAATRAPAPVEDSAPAAAPPVKEVRPAAAPPRTSAPPVVSSVAPSSPAPGYGAGGPTALRRPRGRGCQRLGRGRRALRPAPHRRKPRAARRPRAGQVPASAVPIALSQPWSSAH